MQTFLPYPVFSASAAVLDWQRLGKQRVECKQILTALRLGGAWSNHPATRMWRGYSDSLVRYSIAVCEEWRSRGYNDSLLPYFQDLLHGGTGDPPWLGNGHFHASHRSNLLRKDPVWYGKFCWTEPPTLPYVWPV